MIKILLLAVVPFMTQHRNVVPKTEVSTNFYGSVTGVVTTAYIQERSSVELPQKWALANVTNANGKSVRASDVGALGNSGSQTLNQSYDGLSVTFDSKGTLYTGQYAPSKWSITKEVNDQYHYVQFLGFNGTNYPSFNLFDGESDFYIRLPRKEGTLALQGDVESKADKSALTAHTENTDNPHGVTAGQIGAVPLVEDRNGNKTAVTIGSRLIGMIVGPGSLANGDGVYARGNGSHAAGYNTSAVGDYSRADGGWTEAIGYGSHASGIRASTRPEDAYSFAWNGNGDPDYGVYYSHGVGTFNVNPLGGLDGFYIGEQTLAAILLSSVTNNISATNPTFSNAVLAVGLNIDTNSVAVLNEIAATFGGFPIEGTATTIGGLLAALAAAIAWLKKNKVGSFKSVGGATATVENGVAKLDDFFTESNSLLMGTIDEEVISKGTAPDAHLEAPTDERLKLILADGSVDYDSAKALPYKLTPAIGDRVVATMTLTAASTDITLPTISANDTTVKDFILDVTNAYAVEGVATDAGINIPRTDFKLVTRDGESLTDVTTVKAGKSAFICFTQKSPVVVDGTTYPCWCVIQLPFGDPS